MLFMKPYCEFLPAMIEKDGKPLLGWAWPFCRILKWHLLYRQFHLDEPWDSPHNKELLTKITPVIGLGGVPGRRQDANHGLRWQMAWHSTVAECSG